MKLTPERKEQAMREAQLIVDATERERKASVVIAIVCLLIFVLWMAFSIFVAKLGCLTEWYMWIGGPVTSLLGIGLSVYGLWKNGNKARFWARERAKMGRLLKNLPDPNSLSNADAERAELLAFMEN